jgi:hypothetical protein
MVRHLRFFYVVLEYGFAVGKFKSNLKWEEARKFDVGFKISSKQIHLLQIILLIQELTC